MIKALLTLAFILSFAAAQPARADEPVSQMIDDSGLVISAYSDGAVKETRLSMGDHLVLNLRKIASAHDVHVLNSDLFAVAKN